MVGGCIIDGGDCTNMRVWIIVDVGAILFIIALSCLKSIRAVSCAPSATLIPDLLMKLSDSFMIRRGLMSWLDHADMRW